MRTKWAVLQGLCSVHFTKRHRTNRTPDSKAATVALVDLPSFDPWATGRLRRVSTPFTNAVVKSITLPVVTQYWETKARAADFDIRPTITAFASEKLSDAVFFEHEFPVTVRLLAD
ncbi:hypothetical protein BHC62_03490 [Pseudomonas sp. 06C 126]|nr:hypothetical protein BHC62_03490 [Pseudomonas sp. 06C 126]